MRRLLTPLLTAGLALALAGCASSDTADSDAAPRAETRTLDTAMGTVEVPVDPQRVVVLDSGELDEALSLGVTPVGIVTATGSDDVQPYLADQVEGVPRVGTNTEPELERIAALEPDLIIGTKVRVEAMYDLLSQIAPTVLGETPAAWKDNLRLHGDALGKAGEAEDQIAAFEQRAGELGASLGDPAQISVGVVRFLAGEIRLYAPESFVGSILVDDVGVRLPPAAEAVTGDINATLSLETLDQADADVIYTTAYGDPEATDQALALSLPMWQNLPAVAGGRSYAVDDDVWMLGIGLTGAGLVLDDLERTLAG